MKNIINLALSLVILFIVRREIMSQTNNNPKLAEKKIDISIQQKSFHEILGELATKKKIPIGVQVTEEEEPIQCKDVIDFKLQNVGINEIMSILISQCSAYTWSIENEVVNVFPINKEKSILDVSLAKIKVGNKSSEEIVDLIFNSKEVISELQSEHLKRDTTVAFPRNVQSNLKTYSFKIKDKDLRYVLNYLIRNTENKYWVYYKLDSKKDWISLRIF